MMNTQRLFAERYSDLIDNQVTPEHIQMIAALDTLYRAPTLPATTVAAGINSLQERATTRPILPPSSRERLQRRWSWRTRLAHGSTRLVAASAYMLLLAIVVGALGVVMPILSQGGLSQRPGGQTRTNIVYGYGLLDSSQSGGLVARDLTTGQQIGGVAFNGQSTAWTLAPDGRHAYLLDQDSVTRVWRFSELATPSLRVLHRVLLPNAVVPFSGGQVLTVSADSREVYIDILHTAVPARTVGLSVPALETTTAVAIYDVAQGVFTREIPLAVRFCGAAQLFALADGRLVALCPETPELRGSVVLLDPQQGRQVATVPVGGVSGLPSPDGRRFWLVTKAGQLLEIDLTIGAVARKQTLPTTEQATVFAIPYQQLHLADAGRQLFILAAPHEQVGAVGSATAVWIIDTVTLRRVATVPLPAPTSDVVPLPDGRTLLTGSGSDRTSTEGNDGLRLLELPSGHERQRWEGPFNALVVH